MIHVETRTAVRLHPAEDADASRAEKPEEEPEEEPADPEDAKVITDPGKQKLKWYSP